MPQTVNVAVDAYGNVNLDAEGFTGMSCAEATKKIQEELIGSKVVDEDYKSEYYESSQQDISDRVENCW